MNDYELRLEVKLDTPEDWY